jgi:hypothetical protein
VPLGGLAGKQCPLASALFWFAMPATGQHLGGGQVHEHRNHPSGRRDSANSALAGARPAACAGDVCRRGRGAPHHRTGPEIAARRRRVPDQRGFVCLWTGYIGAVHRIPRGRHSAAGDDGRHFRIGGSDAVDGRGARYRVARHLWLGHCCRNLRHNCRSLHQPVIAVVSTCRDRHDHHGDRHLADARTGPVADYLP